LAAEAVEVEADYVEEKSRRNIEAPQAKRGQAVVQNLVGLLMRLKVERDLMIS